MRTWFFRWAEWRNAFSHTAHLYGFWPEWILRCLDRPLPLLRALAQNSHWKIWSPSGGGDDAGSNADSSGDGAMGGVISERVSVSKHFWTSRTDECSSFRWFRRPFFDDKPSPQMGHRKVFGLRFLFSNWLFGAFLLLISTSRGSAVRSALATDVSDFRRSSGVSILTTMSSSASLSQPIVSPARTSLVSSRPESWSPQLRRKETASLKYSSSRI